MTNSRSIFLALTFLFCGSVLLSAQKSLQAVKLDDKLKIDGVLDPAIQAFGFSQNKRVRGAQSVDFVQYSPRPLAPATFDTEVWVGYDDEALYIVAQLYDAAPDSVLKQLGERDRLRNTDWFGVSINPYQDGINATNFIVTPANVQYDSKFGSDIGGGSNQVMQSGDSSWDGVWESAAKINEHGWLVEMKILYSALRFPQENVQTWDINFARQIRRYREESFWNAVDPKRPDAPTQMGALVGIQNIKPPVRLQATPFVTAAANHIYDGSATEQNQWNSAIGGGLDLKYGITDAFTLDMTAIPDFSNARSDDQVLNLTANEIFFEENRAFFTEGVELFNKGNFFYSRRVGGVPFNYSNAENQLTSDEEVSENPLRTNLLNATKVSGRMDNGLGIGVFNAVEGRSFATLRNTVTGQEREIETGPRSNYTVVSLDQNLANNSFVTLINTTVLREGASYDANLTGAVFDLRDKANDWSLNGKVGISQQYNKSRIARNDEVPTGIDNTIQENVFGHTYNVGADKLTGRLQYGAEFTVESDTYDPNDMGFLFFNNERSGNAYVEYNWFEPKGGFNSGEVEVFAAFNRLYKPDAYNSGFVGADTRWTTRKFFTFGGFAFTETRSVNEFQDTRTPGVSYELPQYFEFGGFISSDYRKRFALDMRPVFGSFWNDSRTRTQGIYISPRFRVSDNLDFRIGGTFRKNVRYLGYIGHTQAAIDRYELVAAGTRYNTLDPSTTGYGTLADDEIALSYRTIRIAELEASSSYSFNAQMNINLRIRHYWSRVNHVEYFKVNSMDGTPRPTQYLGTDEDGNSVHDQNFNAFNVDLFYRWRFAPGSDIFLSYKTQSFYEGTFSGGYFPNLNRLGNDQINNSLTLKMVYWLDVGPTLGKW
ncbi:MAG: DUF5916 domain-containing protein [Saprospiraceae bacterium]